MPDHLRKTITMLTKADTDQLDLALNTIIRARRIIEDIAIAYHTKFENLTETEQEGERGMSINATARDLEKMAESLYNVVSIGETLID